MVTAPLAQRDAHRHRIEFYVGIPIAAAILAAGFRWTEVFEVVSFFILVAIAVVCARIYSARREPEAPWLGGTERIWLLMALGFAFLALDEALSIHENMDVFIHRLLALRETRFTDRIDDLIILGYGMAGALILYAHRAEFRHLSGYRRYFLVGFLLLVMMVAIDLLSNRRDFLVAVGVDGSWVSPVRHVMEVVEELVKLLAEAAFLLGFVRIYRQFASVRTSGLP